MMHCFWQVCDHSILATKVFALTLWSRKSSLETWWVRRANCALVAGLKLVSEIDHQTLNSQWNTFISVATIEHAHLLSAKLGPRKRQLHTRLSKPSYSPLTSAGSLRLSWMSSASRKHLTSNTAIIKKQWDRQKTDMLCTMRCTYLRVSFCAKWSFYIYPYMYIYFNKYCTVLPLPASPYISRCFSSLHPLCEQHSFSGADQSLCGSGPRVPHTDPWGTPHLNGHRGPQWKSEGRWNQRQGEQHTANFISICSKLPECERSADAWCRPKSCIWLAQMTKWLKMQHFIPRATLYAGSKASGGTANHAALRSTTGLLLMGSAGVCGGWDMSLCSVATNRPPLSKEWHTKQRQPPVSEEQPAEFKCKCEWLGDSLHW